MIEDFERISLRFPIELSCTYNLKPRLHFYDDPLKRNAVTQLTLLLWDKNQNGDHY